MTKNHDDVFSLSREEAIQKLVDAGTFSADKAANMVDTFAMKMLAEKEMSTEEKREYDRIQADPKADDKLLLDLSAIAYSRAYAKHHTSHPAADPEFYHKYNIPKTT